MAEHSTALEQVLQQERSCQFSRFSHEDALSLGMRLIDTVKENNWKHIGVRIVLDDVVVFQYLMNDKKDDSWLIRKENTVKKTGHSGLYAFLKKEEYSDLAQDEAYAVCGGGFPININGKLHGAICVSGLPHEKDHQLIAQTLLQTFEEESV